MFAVFFSVPAWPKNLRFIAGFVFAGSGVPGIRILVSQCSATRDTVAATPPVARHDFMIYAWPS